jgi:hypothetical protein
MPAQNSVEAVLNFDAEARVESLRILPVGSSAEREHAAQCFAFEMLRCFISSGMTSTEFDNQTNEEWDARQAMCDEMARHIVTAKVYLLTPDECGAAADRGGNFYQMGYTEYLATGDPADHVFFYRLGGMG